MKTFNFLLFLSLSLIFVSCDNGNNTETTTAPTLNLDKDRLEIYAFHGTRQCATCKNLKANTKATLEKYFKEELKSGAIIYQVVDVDDEKNAALAEKFEATGTALMINNIRNNKENITDWSDFAFEKANDKEPYMKELKSKIEAELK